MKKLLVETNGNFCLHDTLGRQTVEAYRPTVVNATAFIESHRGGKISVLEELAEDASDATLAKAKDAEELEKALAGLPRAKKPNPLDHDGDGRKGGSKPKGK